VKQNKKKNLVQKRMDQGLIALLLVAVIALGGALLQTFKPDFISEATSNALSAMTLALIGIFLSVNGVRLFLALNAREGFEDLKGLEKWKAMTERYQMEEVCSLYTDMYSKIQAVEKGAPPGEVLTDAQARERTDKRFSELMTVPLLSCKSLSDAIAATTEVALVESLSSLKESLLVQIYQTALALRSLLIQSYNQVEDAERTRREGFQDQALCTEDQAKERRAAAKPRVSEEAQRCRLPEEVPKEKLEETIDSLLQRMEAAFDTYAKATPIKDPLSKVVEDCRYWKGELDKKKNEAEATSNKYKIR